MDEQQFGEVLKDKTQEAEECVCRRLQNCLSQSADAGEIYSKTVREAMEYSVMAGGKRLRPLMMRETCRMLTKGEPLPGRREETLEVFMTALEMIHTYSLVHDDLPAMDNDTLRRGRETTWKVYGEGMGVLVGDALMNSAFEIVYSEIFETAASGEDLQWVRRVALCGRILAQKAGIRGMLGGQVADVEAEKKALQMTMDRILFIHKKKTAALIEAAMTIGALLGGADEKVFAGVEKAAENVGVAFQIQDDILDVTGDTEELGKSVGSDAESGKETYLTLMGLERSREEVERMSKEAVEILQSLPGDSLFLEKLFHHLIYRRK